MKTISDAHKLMIYSMYHSGEFTTEQIARHMSIKEWQVKEALWEKPEIAGIDIVPIELERGKVIQVMVPCYGTLSYNDFSIIVDSLFSHYFPTEKNEAVYIA